MIKDFNGWIMKHFVDGKVNKGIKRDKDLKGGVFVVGKTLRFFRITIQKNH